jgi:hypothetical protein
LTERLDQHRGRGQQQITVKHVTVNADEAVVTDQIVSGKGKDTIATKLLSAGTDKPIGIIEPKQNEAMSVEGEGRRQNELQPHAQGPRGPAVYCQIKTDRKALSFACCARVASVPNARRSRPRARRQAEWQLPTRWPNQGDYRALALHQIAALTTNARQIPKLLADRGPQGRRDR